MDAIGPMERRLLGLERRLVHIDEALRQQNIWLVGLGQGIWDAWSDRRRPRGTPTPTPTPPPTFGSCCCCSDYVLPSSLTLTDGTYGDFTLTFDGVSQYAGCKQISFGGTVTCPGTVSMPLYYTIDVDTATCQATLTMLYYGSGGDNCPTSGHTCSDSAPNVSFSSTITLGCYFDTMSWSLTGGNGPHASTGTQTVKMGSPYGSTLTLTDPTYGNVTLTFNGTNTYAGCLQISYPGHGTCPTPRSMPIWYWMVVNPATCQATLNYTWIGDFTGCPSAGNTCASGRPAALRSVAVTLGCSGDTMTWTMGADTVHLGSAWSPTLTLP